MRKHIILLFLILGIVFPMAWLTNFSSTYNRLFTHIFNPLWTHIVTHASLFTILAYLLAHRMIPKTDKALTWRAVFGVLTLVVAIAILQEGFQLLYKDRSPGIDEILDIGIDMVGACFGMAAYWWQSRKGFHSE